MAKGANQKLKLLYLADIFDRNTDAEHTIGMKEIIGMLEERGVNAERKSVYDDIAQLQYYGMDIVKDGNSYFLASRSFETAELKLLVDAIESSRFITEKKSRQLIKKIESLASDFEASALSRGVLVAGRVKSMNESVYYSIDGIHEAMSENKKISFQYFDWSVDKEKVLRRDGKPYVVSPWALTWEDENYYLIAFDGERDMLRHYRVDKMQKISVTDEKREGKDSFAKVDIAEYEKRTFGMFGGTAENVELECDNALAGVIFDRFGRDITLRKSGDDTFLCNVNVNLSPMFLSWVVGFAGKVRIVSPEHVVDEMKDMLEKVYKDYR